MKKKLFRKDINGLRAIAVLSVLIFHFNPSYLPGGFAGVDVFFVISGFLMTSIIFRGVESNNFSIFNFLKARAKRIVPALLVVTIATIAIGFMVTDPSSYKAMGKHAISSLLFISNIIYNSESGYFEAQSHSKFFLHTWSLSVEWQFYIIYPIIICLLKKAMTLKNIKIIILTLFVVSLLASIYMGINRESSSYFMIYSRAWEMLIGGIAYIYPLKVNDSKRKYIELLGLILIISSFFIFSNKTPWPSYNAILPVVGAYLCILSNNSKSMLSFSPIQFIGLISYSVYLIHWPLIVFLYKDNIEINFVAFTLLTLAMASLLYYFVERKREYGYGILAIYIAGVIVSLMVYDDGASSRITTKVDHEYHKKYYGGIGIENDGKAIRFNPEKPVRFILSGDSMARQYANALKDNGIGFVGVFQDGCFSMQNYYTVYDESLSMPCMERYNELMNAINEYKDANVIIAQMWDYTLTLKDNKTGALTNTNDALLYIKKYISDLSNSIDNKRMLYIIGLPDGSRINTNECLQKNQLPLYALIGNNNCDTQKRQKIEMNNILSKYISEIKNTSFINVNDALCSKDECKMFDKDNNQIYSDNIHLSIYGAKIAVDGILKEIK